MGKQKFSIKSISKFPENQKINLLIIVIFASLALTGILLLIPAVQNVGIKIGEVLAGRELRDYDKWHKVLTRGGIMLLVFEVVFFILHCSRIFICHLSQFMLIKLEKNYKVNIFVFVYAFLFFLNFVFPTQSDDIGRGIGNIAAAISTYNSWNARIGELLLILFGSWLSTTPAYAFINALVGSIVIFEFFVLVFGRFPKATYFDVCAVAIEIVWLLFNSCFGSIFFWAAGSFNYLWAYAFILTWLLPFRFLFAKIKNIDCTFNKSNFIKTVLLFILGIFAGWSQELGIVFFILTLISLVYLKILYKAKIPLWCWTALLGFAIGWLILYTAPGPKARAASINANGVVYPSLGDIFRMGPKGMFDHIVKTYNKYKFIIEYFIFSLFLLFTNFLNTRNRKQKLTISILVVLALGFSLLQTPIFLVLCLVVSIFYAWTNKIENPHIAKSFCIFACLFFCITLFTGALIQVDGLPWRAELHYTLLRLIMIWLCLDLFFYWSENNGYSYSVKNLSMMSCSAVCIISILFVCAESFNMRKKWNAMCASVEQQKQLGIEDVVVPASTFISIWENYGDWGNPDKDASVWPNTTYAAYFGVKSYAAE